MIVGRCWSDIKKQWMLTGLSAGYYVCWHALGLTGFGSPCSLVPKSWKLPVAALLRPVKSSPSNPLPTTIPLFQDERNTFIYWGNTPTLQFCPPPR